MNESSSSHAENVLVCPGRREVLHKELDFIQSAINRMAHNSFLVKGWVLSIFAFVFALRSNVSLSKLSLVMVVPVLSFWWLDSFYLRLERAFRDMYADRCARRTVENNWTGLYNMDLQRHLEKQQSVWRIMWSSSTIPFYSVLLLVQASFWMSEHNAVSIYARLRCLMHCLFSNP